MAVTACTCACRIGCGALGCTGCAGALAAVCCRAAGQPSHARVVPLVRRPPALPVAAVEAGCSCCCFIRSSRSMVRSDCTTSCECLPRSVRPYVESVQAGSHAPVPCTKIRGRHRTWSSARVLSIPLSTDVPSEDVHCEFLARLELVGNDYGDRRLAQEDKLIFCPALAPLCTTTCTVPWTFGSTSSTQNTQTTGPILLSRPSTASSPPARPLRARGAVERSSRRRFDQ